MFNQSWYLELAILHFVVFKEVNALLPKRVCLFLLLLFEFYYIQPLKLERSQKKKSICYHQQKQILRFGVVKRENRYQ